MSEKKNYNKNTKSDMQWKCKESKTTFPKKRKQNEIFQQKNPQLLCTKRLSRSIVWYYELKMHKFRYILLCNFCTFYNFNDIHTRKTNRPLFVFNKLFRWGKKRGRSKLCWCIQIKNKLNVTWIEIARKRGWEWEKKNGRNIILKNLHSTFGVPNKEKNAAIPEKKVEIIFQ